VTPREFLLIRKRLQLTQDELAKKLKVHRCTVWRAERLGPSRVVLLELEKVIAAWKKNH